MKKLMQNSLSIFNLASILTFFLLFATTSCSKDSEEEDSGEITSLLNRSITIDYNYGQYLNEMTVTPIDSKKCNVTGMTNGASSYVYQRIDSKKAAFTVTGVQRLSSNTYTYFWEYTLAFTDTNQGTITGTYMAKTGAVFSISGRFSIK